MEPRAVFGSLMTWPTWANFHEWDREPTKPLSGLLV